MAERSPRETSQYSEETQEALYLWIVLNRAARSIEAGLQEQVKGRGLSMSEFAVLEVLLHKGPLPIGEIGQKVLLTSGSMTYVIDKLEERGLLERTPCPEDRRVLYAELTDEGRALIEEAFSEHAELLNTLTAGLSLEEKGKAAALIKRLGRHAQQELQSSG